MPTPFVADAADEAVRSNSILNERKATDIIEETALEVDIRAWRAEGLRLLQAASAREDQPNGARRPWFGPRRRVGAGGDRGRRDSNVEDGGRAAAAAPRARRSTSANLLSFRNFVQRTLSTVALFFITLFGGGRDIAGTARRAARARVARRIFEGCRAWRHATESVTLPGRTLLFARSEARLASYKSYIWIRRTASSARLASCRHQRCALRHCNWLRLGIDFSWLCWLVSYRPLA